MHLNFQRNRSKFQPKCPGDSDVNEERAPKKRRLTSHNKLRDQVRQEMVGIEDHLERMTAEVRDNMQEIGKILKEILHEVRQQA